MSKIVIGRVTTYVALIVGLETASSSNDLWQKTLGYIGFIILAFLGDIMEADGINDEAGDDTNGMAGKDSG